jgi:hypothetical protein
MEGINPYANLPSPVMFQTMIQVIMRVSVELMFSYSLMLTFLMAKRQVQTTLGVSESPLL